MKRLLFNLRNRRNLWLICVICVISGCNKKKFFDGPDQYSDDFENYTALADLLPADESHWSFTQITNPYNSIVVNSANFHNGTHAMKFSAKKSTDRLLSKCSIAKQNMAFWEGETMQVSAWYYLAGTDKLDWLFLMDFEEQTAIGAGPGMRLALVDNKLRVEYKFNEKDIVQTAGQEIDLPRDQWVNITWEVKLSQKNKGEVRLWQDGNLIINTTKNRTLPKDLLYDQQGTKGMYSSVEVGVTADSYDNDAVVYVDDVVMKKLN